MLSSAGAQKELDQWPVFLELLCLMPHQFTHIHFISPDVPSNLAGKCKAFRLQQINADTQCAKLEMTDSQDADLSLVYGDVGDDSSKQNWELPRRTLANLDAIAVPTPCDVSSSADSDDITSGLQLSFHTGCYHDVAHELQCRSAPPDLVFGANAGALFCSFNSCPPESCIHKHTLIGSHASCVCTNLCRCVQP